MEMELQVCRWKDSRELVVMVTRLSNVKVLMPLNCTLHNGLGTLRFYPLCILTQLRRNPSGGGKSLLALHILLKVSSGAHKT